jgi:hypothetical protein
MYLQEILEVAIGLVFMWLVISLATMQFQEWIANALKWRSKDLEGAIRKMLADPDLAKEFYNHQLIRGLTKEIGFWDKIGNFFRRIFGQSEKQDKKPSYIPANDFALTVFDIITQAGTAASPIQKAIIQINSKANELFDQSRKGIAAQDLNNILVLAKHLANTNAGAEAIDSLKLEITNFVKKYPELEQASDLLIPVVDSYFKDLTNARALLPLNSQANNGSAVSYHNSQENLALNNLRIGLFFLQKTNPDLAESLRSMLTGAEEYVKEKEHALVVARTNVETWFNNSMDRLSGWYKRKSQLAAFIVGLVLAMLLNVDSITLSTTLWREPTLRQAIVAQAQAYVKENPQGPAVTATPTAMPEPGATPNASQPATEAQTLQAPGKTVAELQKELQALNIPLGWELTPFDAKGKACAFFAFDKSSQVFGFSNLDETGQQVCKHVSNLPTDFGSWAAKIAGILMTGAAAAQGAPFWFDILKKLINVRSTGPNPAEKEKAAG